MATVTCRRHWYNGSKTIWNKRQAAFLRDSHLWHKLLLGFKPVPGPSWSHDLHNATRSRSPTVSWRENKVLMERTGSWLENYPRDRKFRIVYTCLYSLWSWTNLDYVCIKFFFGILVESKTIADILRTRFSWAVDDNRLGTIDAFWRKHVAGGKSASIFGDPGWVLSQWMIRDDWFELVVLLG